MRGTIQLNGWLHNGTRKLRPGVISSQYRNPANNWTATEQFAGPTNRPVGLVVRDERGAVVGTVKSVLELP